jgi:cardiolipin synthase A/B
MARLRMHGDGEVTPPFYDATESRNEIRLLVDATDVLPRVFEMISHARLRICLEMYLLEGEIGERVCETLCRRAREGVAVRILYQPPGSLAAYQKLMRGLSQVGLKSRITEYRTCYEILDSEERIQVRSYPLHLFPGRWGLRMAHGKVLIIDGTEAMTGGVNLASITEHNHDVMLTVHGPVANEMEKVFAHSWRLAKGEDFRLDASNCQRFPGVEEKPELAWVRYLVCVPHLENAKGHLLSEIRAAKRQLWVAMFLFTDEDLVGAVIAASRRGVDVRVLLDANRLALELDLHGFPNKVTIQKLMRAAVPVRVFVAEPGQEMHMKVALFDDHRAVVGSTNWTTGSFRFNSEGCLAIRRGAVQETLRALFQEDWETRSVPASALSAVERIVARGLKALSGLY